ncbi:MULTISPECIES: TetR/AcrR family transcriptional regulator [Actinokineospora]|uniref:DNA-binding transcriptional regulator n=1 Tax=Actinokineospora fastidiosa TaxID=1816 RepID=A0A918GRJ2_9PSEU|nr:MULTISPECIES: TetR family transcriptional regulator [Actinokineospora]UVS81558.1 transcriptional repressor BetI [Actinokineospora sp. UTMC 2448]GGS57196.1 DNA-binding transcriptional regulator [Actinokineospora fastidiosa]
MARDPEGRRLRILEAACALIAETGVGALTHRAVAARAGVPVGATTYYFATLDELATSAIAHAAELAAGEARLWQEAIAAAEDVPATVAALIADYLADHRPWSLIEHELYVAAAHRPELRPMAIAWSDGTTAALSPRVGPAAARAVTVFLDGVMLDALVRDAPVDADFLARAVAALMGLD